MADYGPQKASAALPYAYRWVITTLEPLIVLGGILHTMTNPADFLATMTRDSVPYDPRTHFLYTELAGAWILLLFLEVFALRHLDDLRVWRWVCFGVALQDAFFLWSVAEALGGWEVWKDVAGWERTDWLVFWTTAPAVIVRVLILLGIGVKEARPKRA